MDPNDELYRRVLEAVPHGIWVVDPRGQTIFSNPHMAEILGIDFKSMAEQSCFACVFPHELEDAQRHFAEALAGDRRPFDFRLRRADGSPIWVSISCQPMMDQAGSVVGLLGMFSDISARKQAESALRESEERFRVMFLQADVGIAQTSLDGKWLLLNDRFCDLLGYTQAELRGKTYIDVTHPDDCNKNLVQRNQMLAGEISAWTTEKRYIRKDGAIVWAKLNVSLVRDADGAAQYFIAVVEDITERIRAESALRDSERRLSLALKAANLGVWDCDLDKKQVALSPKYKDVYSRAPLSFGEWLDLVHPDDRERIRTLARESLTKSHQWDAEFRILLPDGSVRWMHSTAVILLNDGGNPVRLVGVSQDVTEWKNAESVLRESEARFRNLADTAPVMIWVSGPDQRCTFFNQAWLDFTGRTMNQELGNGWADGVHPDDIERCLATYTSAFDARGSFRTEYRLRRFDGEYRWVLCTGVPRFAPESFFSGYIGSCVDVTDQKETEERLRAGETRLLDAQRLAKVGSWERHLETDRIYWSDQMVRIVGLEGGAPPDFKAFLNCVHAKDREKILDADRQLASGAGSVKAEFRIVRPDGEVRFVRSIIEAIRDDLGKPVRIVGTTQDVTDQVRAHDRLRDSEERLKNAERLAHVGHWQWDILANRVSGSEEMLRIFGDSPEYTPDYAGFLRTLVPEDKERVERAVREALESRMERSIEYRIVRPDGEMRTVSCIVEILVDDEGMPVQMFGACQDVTNLRREQEESFTRQKLESVGTLAGGIAHDFNNLLGAILAQVELALTEIESGSAPEEELKSIAAVAIRGSEIVRQLMIYAGNESEAIGPVDLSRTVAEMVELLKVSVSKNVMLVTDLAQDLPPLQASASQIRRIVMNLVTNASQAIGNRDGVIRVNTRGVAAAQAWALASGGGERDFVELEVSDNGCGMSQETRAKVFDPFFTTRAAGHGLGLAVVQGIVRNLGGTIHLASEPGKGATFRILMPCSPAPSEEAVGALSSPEQPERLLLKAAVLVVEDEEVLRRAVVKLLRKMGAEVLEAANGSAAIDLLRSKDSRLDVILLDLTIPGPSSQEVLAEAAQGRPDLKVILTSAYSEEVAAVSIHSPQIRSFIRKPFRLEDLVHTIGNVLAS